MIQEENVNKQGDDGFAFDKSKGAVKIGSLDSSVQSELRP